MKVVKFGGSSLADGPQFQKVIDIIKADPARQVVITSAPGKRQDTDIKVTDLLIKYAKLTIAQQDYSEVVAQISARYQAIGTFFKVPAEEMTPIKEAIVHLPNHDYPDNDYLMAAFKAHGERLNARLMATVLNNLGIKARFVDPKECGLIVSDEPNNATVLPETYTNLAQFDYGDERLIFPGFFGFTKKMGRLQPFHGAVPTSRGPLSPVGCTPTCMKTLLMLMPFMRRTQRSLLTRRPLQK